MNAFLTADDSSGPLIAVGVRLPGQAHHKKKCVSEQKRTKTRRFFYQAHAFVFC